MIRRTLCLAAVGVSALLAASPEDGIREAEKSWAAAVVARDYAALDRILGSQLIYAHASGAVESKEAYLQRLRTGAQRYDRIEHESVTVRVYGDAAVAHCKVRMAGEANKRPFNDYLMAMHFWVKQGGHWRLAAHQTTRLE